MVLPQSSDESKAVLCSKAAYFKPQADPSIYACMTSKNLIILFDLWPKLVKTYLRMWKGFVLNLINKMNLNVGSLQALVQQN